MITFNIIFQTRLVYSSGDIRPELITVNSDQLQPACFITLTFDMDKDWYNHR